MSLTLTPIHTMHTHIGRGDGRATSAGNERSRRTRGQGSERSRGTHGQGSCCRCVRVYACVACVCVYKDSRVQASTHKQTHTQYCPPCYPAAEKKKKEAKITAMVNSQKEDRPWLVWVGRGVVWCGVGVVGYCAPSRWWPNNVSVYAA